jgi:hypothetical protein
VRNCLTDESRPLGIGLQEQIPNHLWRLWSKAMVVSAEGKGPATTGSGVRQEEDCKGTTVEVSKTIRRCQNRGVIATAGLAPTVPVYGRSGIRHERWPELAMRRLGGTWEPAIAMLTEKPQVEIPRGREYGCAMAGAEQRVVAMKSPIKGWSQGAVSRTQLAGSTRNGRNSRVWVGTSSCASEITFST